MRRRLDRVLAISGTLTFVLGWAAIIYLMIDPSSYAETVGRGAVETALGYGPIVMVASAAQWLVAAYIQRQGWDGPSSN